MEQHDINCLLCDSACDAILLFKGNSFFYCNKVALELFGCSSKEEFFTKHPADLSPEFQPDGVNSRIAVDETTTKIFEKGYSRFDWVHKRLDNGKEFPAEVILNVIELNGEKIIQATIRDITERKELYEQLRKTAEREKFLRDLIENFRKSIDIDEVLTTISQEVAKVFNVDRVTIIQFINPFDYQKFIVRKEHRKEKTVKSAVKINDYKQVIEYWSKIVPHELSVLGIDDIEKSDLPDYFKEFYINLEVKSIIAVTIVYDNEVWGAMALSDIKQIRTWTDEEKTLLKTISNQIYFAVKHAEMLEATRMFANREKFFAEVTSIIKSSLDIDEIQELVTKKVKEFYKADEVIIDLHSDEKIKLVFSPQIAVRKDMLVPLRCIGDNLAIADKQSEFYTRSKYFSNLSHELRTPLAIIDGYANNLFENSNFCDEQAKKQLNIILKNTGRITDIIDSMLTLSRLENKENKVGEFQKIYIHEIINNMLQIHEGFANKNIKIETYFDEQLAINGNAILIEQALLNLVNNAFQYSPENSKIIIRVEKNNGNSLISVQDFGAGIEEKYFNLIFERFYRIDKSRDRAKGGSGLGLAIVKSIAEVHHGNVIVKSEVGKGSTFTIEIPCF